MYAVTVEFDGVSLERDLDAAQEGLERSVPALLETIGLILLKLVKIAYEVKGRGGTGSDGITWLPLKPETIRRKNARRRNNRSFGAGASQIGVDYGLQRNSATPGFRGPDPNPDDPRGSTGNVFLVEGVTVTVGYGRSYSVFFDRVRPLFPAVLPPSWEKEVDAAAEDWGYKVVSKAFGGGGGTQAALPF